MTQEKTIIIGSGAGGLATAILLAKSGHNVHVYEKNESYGGRGSVFSAQGFQFDMGPSWYLMPDIFEHFFQLIGENVSDHLTLKKLDPSYRIWFENQSKPVDLYSDLERDAAVFESFQPGIMQRLKPYLKEAAAKYKISKDSFIYKPFNSILDFLDRKTMLLGTKYSVFSSFDRHLRRYVTHPLARKILQYPLVFLGSSPYKAPAVYSLMNHIDFDMGVYYPMGGMHEVFKALYTIATKAGVTFHFNASVQKIIIDDTTKKAKAIKVNDTIVEANNVVSNADYHFTETALLPQKYQQFSERYWKSRMVAPSGFMLYLGVDKKFPSLTHHNLFFADKWKASFDELFDHDALPGQPSYYVCAPSVTDPGVAPEGSENLFVLVPTSSGLTLDDATIKSYRDKIITHMEQTLDMPGLSDHIVFERVFTGQDFSSRYNAFRGTALGLAQNLLQTAVFRPKTVSKKVKNLFYTGANTNPGIGVPMCLISAQVVYKRMFGIKHGRPLSKTDLYFDS